MARTATKTLHYHACTQCKWRYPDGCETPDVNGMCGPCRGGHPHTQHGLAARECCKENARLARKDELKTYHLRGNTPWFICTVCWRQFGYNPRTTHA